MLDIKNLYEEDYINKKVVLSGWIRNHRRQAHFGFIDLSDGTTFRNLQVVYDDKLPNFDEYTAADGISGYKYKSVCTGLLPNLLPSSRSFKINSSLLIPFPGIVLANPHISCKLCILPKCAV